MKSKRVNPSAKRRQSADTRRNDRQQLRTASQPNDRVLWQRRFEHFTTLAQAQAAHGNAVDAENFYQHAEHYFRIMREATAA